MRHTIPYTQAVEELDGAIANLADNLNMHIDTATEADVITEDESEKLYDLLDLLEEIRGVIND